MCSTNKWISSDNVLRDKALNFNKNPKYDGFQCGIVLMVYNFFDKKKSGSAVKNENMWNQKLENHY